MTQVIPILCFGTISNSAYGDELNKVENLPLGNFTLRIDVKDNMYSAYVNGIRQPQLT
jgi:hypothetical protein